jgi:hypothetical protein
MDMNRASIDYGILLKLIIRRVQIYRESFNLKYQEQLYILSGRRMVAPN